MWWYSSWGPVFCWMRVWPLPSSSCCRVPYVEVNLRMGVMEGSLASQAPQENPRKIKTRTRMIKVHIYRLQNKWLCKHDSYIHLAAVICIVFVFYICVDLKSHYGILNIQCMNMCMKEYLVKHIRITCISCVSLAVYVAQIQMMVRNMTRLCVWAWSSYWWRSWTESFLWSLWGPSYWSLTPPVSAGRPTACYTASTGTPACLIRRDCWTCCGICGKSFPSTAARLLSLWISWDTSCWKLLRPRRKRYYKCISHDVGKGIMKHSFLTCI